MIPELLGLTFMVFLMPFAFVLFVFSLRFVETVSFNSFVKGVAAGDVNLIPLGVLVAVLIFFLKEILEFNKRKLERRRKIRACKNLLSNELRLNLWVHNKFVDIISNIKNEKHLEAKFLYLKRGIDDCILTEVEGKSTFGCPIPMVHDKFHEKLIVNIAEVDGHLFGLTQASYDGLVLLEHIRKGLIDGLCAEKNNEQFYPHDIRDSGFLDYALDELDEVYKSMNSLYFECAGKELTESKLR